MICLLSTLAYPLSLHRTYARVMARAALARASRLCVSPRSPGTAASADRRMTVIATTPLLLVGWASQGARIRLYRFSRSRDDPSEAADADDRRNRPGA
jgi:hypothetical protein